MDDLVEPVTEAAQSQSDRALSLNIDESLQRCHVAGKEIDVTSLPFSKAEWRICSRGCRSLSECNLISDG
mgnify:CR=1 FL=1